MLLDGSTINSDLIIIIIISDIIMGNSVKSGLCFVFSGKEWILHFCINIQAIQCAETQRIICMIIFI